MSQITVGYTDKARKVQAKGPAGTISDIFGFSNDSCNKNQQNGKQQEISQATTESHSVETKICEKTESLKIEENSNVVKQIQVTTSVEVTNNSSSNGNLKENGNVEEVQQTPKKAANNIIHADERDSTASQKRNRVPPGGYSSGGFW